MRRILSCLPLALLLIANVVPSKAQKSEAAAAAAAAEAAEAEAEAGEVVMRVREGAPFQLECSLRVEQRAAWRRVGGSGGSGGGALPAGLRPAGEAPARAPATGLLALLRAPAARAHMAGVYACAPGPNAQRVRLLVDPAPGVETTAAPAAGDAAPAEPGADEEAAEREAGPVVYYDMQRPFSLNCTLDKGPKEVYIWSKNGSLIFEEATLKSRFKLSADGATLEQSRALEDDWGNYSCSVGAAGAAGAAGARQAWRLHARVYTRLPSANTNVVEGQKLRLICKVMGRPAPAVEWRYNESYSAPDGALALAVEALGAERVVVRDSEAGVRGGELLLDAARRSDAGSYVCAPLAPPAALAESVPFGHTTLRVKDMYAALWPFLGICAEVLVLCAVILVYEKRRTKPELDDSDTDNHDQKKS